MKTEAQLKKILESLNGLDSNQACDVVGALVLQDLLIVPNWYTPEHLEDKGFSADAIELAFSWQGKGNLVYYIDPIVADELKDDLVAVLEDQKV